MKEIKLVIFDMDGLLINSERCMWANNTKKLFEDLGYEYNLEWHRALMGLSHDYFKKSSLERFGNDFPFETFYNELTKLNLKTIENKEIPLMDGALEILEYLKKNNIKFTIATSTKRDLTNKILKSCDIDKYFDIITTGDEIRGGKPSPEIYNVAVSKFNVPKENTLVLEDGHIGFLSAFNAGLNCVIVEDFAILQDYDKQNAYRIVKSLKDVITLIEENN